MKPTEMFNSSPLKTHATETETEKQKGRDRFADRCVIKDRKGYSHASPRK